MAKCTYPKDGKTTPSKFWNKLVNLEFESSKIEGHVQTWP